MSNREISKSLYDTMTGKYDAYLCLEKQYKEQTDYYKKQPIIDRMANARKDWLDSVQDFRAHLSYLRKRLPG